MSVPSPVIVVVAKAPVPGQAKTRLTPPLAPGQAADLAAAALLDTLDTVAAAASAGTNESHAGRPVVALTGDVERAVRRAALKVSLRRFDVIGQHGTSLAQRLVAAHLNVARRRPGRPTLFVGMDTPQVTVAELSTAAGRLTAPGPGALLGPAMDGGWWALGLRDPRMARVLARVPTSRRDTGRRTAEALARAGSPPAVLPCRRDVDTWADACVVAGTNSAGRFAATVRAMPLPVTNPAAGEGSARVQMPTAVAEVRG